MNQSTKPSENFYLHVNEKWINDPENQIPPQYSKWGGFIKLHDQGIMNQIQLIERMIQNKKDRPINEVIETNEEFKITEIWKASKLLFKSWNEGKANYDPLITELKILNQHLPLDTTSNHLKIAEYLYYTQINGISNVFDFDNGSDLKNSNCIVLDLSTSGLSLPSREYYTDDNFKDKRELFKKHLESVIKLIKVSQMNLSDDTFSQTFNQTFSQTFVEDVIEFETMIAKTKMKKDQARKYDEYYTNTTLTNLHQKINSLKSLPEKQDNYNESDRNFLLSDELINKVSEFFEKVYELFDFRRIMKNNKKKWWPVGTEDKNDIPEPDDEHITAFDGDAIRRIVKMILEPMNYQKYRSFLQYKLIIANKEYCTKELDDEFFDFYTKTLEGQTEKKSEDKRSIQLINAWAGEMMGKLYVSKYFPESNKKDIKDMVNEILNQMVESIKKNDWLTESTKNKAVMKLKKFNLKIGYPDRWQNYDDFDIKENDSLFTISKKAKKWYLKTKFLDRINSMLDRNEWLMTPQTVNAYFMPTQNEIVFPAAILQSPFFNKNKHDIDFDISNELTQYPDYDFLDAANFGGIGAVIAHEITHGYDDQGRKFDGDGNLNDWWTKEDQKLFELKTELMAKQASGYYFTDGDTKYQLNAQLTMGENLADLGGLSLGLQGLTHRLVLKGEDLDVIKANQRVFFKSFANIWKQNTKKDYIIKCMTTDPHAPSDFRANLVKNIKEFYDVFDVKEKDAMWIPDDQRVVMW